LNQGNNNKIIKIIIQYSFFARTLAHIF